MGNTSDLFKKIRDTNVAFNPKMDTIKDRNSKDQVEEKRGGNKTQRNCTEKILITWITTMV